MNTALIDLPDQRVKLFPFTMTRPVGYLRIGMLSIKEKWEMQLSRELDSLSPVLLNNKFQKGPAPYELVINAAICPDKGIVEAISKLNQGQALISAKGFIAACGNFVSVDDLKDLESFENQVYEDDYCLIERSWDLFLNNADQIKKDFEWKTNGKKSCAITDPHTIVYSPENIFLEEGVTIKAAILNAENGPIYLSKGSEIQEGATIRGPFFLGENSKINMNAKIREGSSIGPNCKVGGEISNSIIYANSNKAHGGFLGNSVIGEYCNLGAATNCSNLKNNYDKVKMWDYKSDSLIETGLQFCGLMMGDHSKSAIGSTFNTGTTIGSCCNIFGSGFPKTIIPSFTWGGANGMVTHNFEKAMETAANAMKRRGRELSVADKEILSAIFEESAKLRV